MKFRILDVTGAEVAEAVEAIAYDEALNLIRTGWGKKYNWQQLGQKDRWDIEIKDEIDRSRYYVLRLKKDSIEMPF